MTKKLVALATAFLMTVSLFAVGETKTTASETTTGNEKTDAGNNETKTEKGSCAKTAVIVIAIILGVAALGITAFVVIRKKK
ncbi:MAG: hypothetical protein K6G60_06215 [Lachnospiraceae bacterium]|nr:hypothetical protein [Lachnospiraceae bacterium]